MSRENPLWGAPRIHGELLKLGIDIGETSVGKYIVRHRKPPSQTWRTFLDNHVKTMVSVDFFTVPTIRFKSSTYSWCSLTTAAASSTSMSPLIPPPSGPGQQLREAFPFDRVPRYLLRDRDGIFGDDFTRHAKAMGP